MRLVLTNAIYFKGKWASQFKKSQTRQGLFRLAPGKSVDVSMMTQKTEVQVYERDCLKILFLA
jgi:serpin B